MCGRFAVTLPSDAMAQLFSARPANDLPEGPNFNVCPTDKVAVVRSDATGRVVQSMRWGFVPHWYKALNGGPLLINARAETIAQKPAFQAACRARRCLIPVCGFYEWTKDPNGARMPWYIQGAQADMLAFAGIWQDWGTVGDTVRSCAIVTCAANRAMSAIHHRMPVIVAPEDWPLWLGDAGVGAARLMTCVAEDALRFHRVDAAVNSNAATGAELIEQLVL